MALAVAAGLSLFAYMGFSPDRSRLSQSAFGEHMMERWREQKCSASSLAEQLGRFVIFSVAAF